ncbi:MAG: SMC-Scp complex subunit ScpB [Solobacterium sp.]|nr:SMC-Scp complex subunit ScpB [Solobacterium sp.]
MSEQEILTTSEEEVSAVETPQEEEHSVEFIEADEPEQETAKEEEPPVEEPIPEEIGEQVEQLSLLDGQLPHLEAANAPDAPKAKAILEGLLFIVGDEGVTAEQAAQALDITPELAAEYFDDLMKEYTDDRRGIEIANYAGTYRFLSKAVVFDYAKKLFQISKTSGLSQAALETLAIIAYKQPITRVEIEEIRGVGADMMLRKLMARDLIRESGRSEAAGRPILYEVTEEFMNSFKLLSLKELPELPQFNNDEESEDLFNQ